MTDADIIELLARWQAGYEAGHKDGYAEGFSAGKIAAFQESRELVDKCFGAIRPESRQ